MLLSSGKCRPLGTFMLLLYPPKRLQLTLHRANAVGGPSYKATKPSFTCGLDTAGHSHAGQNCILDSVLRSPLASNLRVLVSQQTVR